MTPAASHPRLCGCTYPRVESFTWAASRRGLVKIRRCVECGTQGHVWIRMMDPPPPEPATAAPAYPRSAEQMGYDPGTERLGWGGYGTLL